MKFDVYPRECEPSIEKLVYTAGLLGQAAGRIFIRKGQFLMTTVPSMDTFVGQGTDFWDSNKQWQ